MDGRLFSFHLPRQLPSTTDTWRRLKTTTAEMYQDEDSLNVKSYDDGNFASQKFQYKSVKILNLIGLCNSNKCNSKNCSNIN